MLETLLSNRMKKLLLVLVCFVGLGNVSFAQEQCDELPKIAGTYLEENNNGSYYVSDGQVYTAFVDADQPAEFYATFYGGSKYRIAATAGSGGDYVIIELHDSEGNVLYSNEGYENSPYWNFEVESTMDVKIVLKIDSDKKDSDSGCITMLIGFEQ